MASVITLEADEQKRAERLDKARSVVRSFPTASRDELIEMIRSGSPKVDYDTACNLLHQVADELHIDIRLP